MITDSTPLCFCFIASEMLVISARRRRWRNTAAWGRGSLAASRRGTSSQQPGCEHIWWYYHASNLEGSPRLVIIFPWLPGQTPHSWPAYTRPYLPLHVKMPDHWQAHLDHSSVSSGPLCTPMLPATGCGLPYRHHVLKTSCLHQHSSWRRIPEGCFLLAQ